MGVAEPTLCFAVARGEVRCREYSYFTAEVKKRRRSSGRPGVGISPTLAGPGSVAIIERVAERGGIDACGGDDHDVRRHTFDVVRHAQVVQAIDQRRADLVGD